MTFDEMAKMVIEEYNSEAKQLQVQSILKNLHFDRCMTETETSNQSEGVLQLVDVIERLMPQCQPQFRSGANNITFLRRAVIAFKWAMTPIGSIITAKYTFTSFVNALREHLQLDSELSSRRSVHDGMQRFHEHTFFQPQGRNQRYSCKHPTTETGLRHGSNPLAKLSFE